MKKTGYCYFRPKKATLKDQKEQKLASFLSQRTFQLNQKDLIKVPKKEEPKRMRFQPKQTK